MFLGNPPAPLGSLSPSLFYTGGTIAGIVAPMSASYLEVAGASPHACPVTGTVMYSLEVTYPNTFAFATTGSGYMATIITPGTADGTSYHAALFRAGGCATLAGPSVVNVSGGTLSFVGGGALTINANETDVVEFWH
jgi:Flp pilus assembly secretin CpaC